MFWNYIGNDPQPDACVYVENGQLWARPLTISAALVNHGGPFPAEFSLTGSLRAVRCERQSEGR